MLPDVALVAACITLFYCLFLFHGYQKLFRDSDSGWHIRTGEAILSAGALPRTDPYSFTRGGQPWFAWEWTSDVLMGAAHRAGGLGAVALLYALAIAAGVWLWFRLHWAVHGNFLLACALAAPLLSTCNLHWLARPHIFSWLFLLGAIICAEKGAPSRAALPGIAAATVLWTNLHASFFFAPLIASLYGFSCFLRPLIWDLDLEPEWSQARRYTLAAVVSTFATLLNPYGWALHRHVFQYLWDSQLLSRVGEFQSFDFHTGGSGQILLALGVAAVGGVAALAQRKLAHLLLVVLFLGSGLRYARGLPLVALLLLPLANGAITRALENAKGLRPRVRSTLDTFLAYSGRLRALDAGLQGLMWVPLAVLAAWGLLRIPAIAERTGFPQDQFPVAAALAVEHLPAQARLLAPDKFGGYLIYRFEGRRKVFFDGRSDLYGAEFLRRYGRLAQVRPGWRALLASWSFTHALLPDDYSLIPALEQAGWKPVYRDATATLLAAPPGFAGTS
jgi:hypothetical protein